MSKNGKNEQVDSNTSQGKPDILRAIDIIPVSSEAGEKKEKLQALRSVDKQQYQIPKFNLAEEIMAEQRKTASNTRKAPGKKSEIPRGQSLEQQISPAIERPLTTPSQEDQIIKEIVAKDIEAMYRGLI